MLPQQEAGVRASLASRGATKIKVEGTTVRDMVRTLFAEEFAKLKKVRLTWNPSTLPEPPDPSLRIGLLCKWRPYTGPLGIGRYYIQNMMVLYSNGEQVTDMRTISEEKRVERIVDGKGNFLREQVFASDRELVDNSLRYYMQIAIRLDPNLCKYCVQFTTDDRNEYLKHVRKKHPEEFAKMLAGDDEEEEETEPPPPPKPPPPKPPPPSEPVPDSEPQAVSRKSRAAAAAQ